MSFKFRISLQLLMTLLFVLVTALIGAGITYENYNTTRALILDQTHALIDAAADRFTADTQRTYHPIGLTLEIFSQSRLRSAPTRDERLATVPLFLNILESEPHVRAILVGNEHGEFFTVGRINNVSHAQLLKGPTNAAFFVTDNRLESDGKMHSLRLFLTTNHREMSRIDLGIASYDPRVRPWYQQAMVSSDIVVTAPYLFAAESVLGFTLASRSVDGRQVFAADVTLHQASRDLSKERVTPGTKMAIFDPHGQLIAYTDEEQLYANEDGVKKRSRYLDEVTNSPLQAVATRALNQPSASIQFTYQGSPWLAVTREIKPSSTLSRRLLIMIPLNELLADAHKSIRKSLSIAALLLLCSIPLIWLASASVTRPLSRLVEEARRIRRFDFSQPVNSKSVIREIRSLNAALDSMKATIRQFLHLVDSLANETDFPELLKKVNHETLKASHADASILYLLDESGARLVPGGLKFSDQEDAPLDLLPVSLKDTKDVLTAVFHSNQDKVIEVHRDDGELGSLFAGIFDTVSADVLTFMLIPLANRQDEVAGILALAFKSETLADGGLQDRTSFVHAMSGFAAVSIESQQLIRMQKELLNSFIKLIAGAIDAKSPYTGGHCQRVPVLTELLAKAACQSQDPRFAGFSLTQKQWEAVNIASWLHDCGKVTTPEYVVDKSTKLETLTDRIHEVRMRFEVLKRDAAIRCWQGIAEGGDSTALKAALAAAEAELDADFSFVAECNLGGEFMAPEKMQRLEAIAARTWMRTLDDRIGISWEEAQRKNATPAPSLPTQETLLSDKPEHIIERDAHDLLPEDNPWGFRLSAPALKFNRGEMHNLRVERGTLTDEERYIINDHIVQTIIMLEKLPFPRHLREVPALAGGHHEKMDGTGYPKRLMKDEMPMVARMMAIADIFEALTAADRPYKKPKKLSESLRIMSFMKKDQHIDGDLFELFLRSGVYQEYAQRFLSPDQIDDVDVEKLLTT